MSKYRARMNRLTLDTEAILSAGQTVMNNGQNLGWTERKQNLEVKLA
jgi:hypothetical protein